MKRRLIFALACVLVLCLTACSLTGARVLIWRAVSEYSLETGTAIESEYVRVNTSMSVIDATVTAFNSAAGESELERALPEGIEITDWELDDTDLKLYVSAGYASVTGYRRSIGDACMVLTFCAIDGVETVSVYSGETLLTSAMDENDIILTDTQ